MYVFVSLALAHRLFPIVFTLWRECVGSGMYVCMYLFVSLALAPHLFPWVLPCDGSAQVQSSDEVAWYY